MKNTKIKAFGFELRGEGYRNVLLRNEGDGFHISYRPAGDTIMSFGMFAVAKNPNPLVEKEETALVGEGKMLILIGDFRKEYSELFSQGYNTLKKFYDLQKKSIKYEC